MTDERIKLHKAVDIIPEADLPRICAMIYAYIESGDEVLSEDEELELAQIKNGDYIDANVYWTQRGVN